jgi:hypothetical protein
MPIGSFCWILAFTVMAAIAIRRRRLQQQQTLIEAALPTDRARLVELALDRFGIDAKALTQGQQAGIVLERLRQRSGRFRWMVSVSAGLLVISLVTALIAYALSSSGLYQIRVTVLDLDGQPTDETQLRSSVDGVPKKLPGGWELEIPKVKRPAGGQVTLWATKESLSAPPVEVELAPYNRAVGSTAGAPFIPAVGRSWASRP